MAGTFTIDTAYNINILLDKFLRIFPGIYTLAKLDRLLRKPGYSVKAGSFSQYLEGFFDIQKVLFAGFLTHPQCYPLDLLTYLSGISSSWESFNPRSSRDAIKLWSMKSRHIKNSKISREIQKHVLFIWATFKTLLAFRYTAWLIGILIMAYYNPHITG